MSIPLTDELLLLGYDDTTGKQLLSHELDLGLAGAVLLELALAERIDVDGGRVVVRNPAPTGDAIVDAALARIVADGKRRKPQAWVERLQKKLRAQVLARLTAAGTVRRVEDKVLGIIPRTRYPAGDPRPKADARARLDAAVRHGVRPDARTAALASLVLAASLARKVLPDVPRKDAKRRLAEVSAGEWAGPAVRKAIDAVNAATAAAVVAATTVAATGS